MEYPLYDFNDFNDFNDFDFTDNDNDIMVNETTTNLSKGIEEIFGSASGSNNNQPVIDELNSNQNLPANAEVELQSPLTKNEQTQLDQMNVDLDKFGEVSHHNNSNPFHVPLDQLIASPDVPNESFLHGLSSDPNFEQPIYSGFEGNDNDAHQTTSPPFTPHIMERTNSFPLPLAERLSEDRVYTDQPIYSEPRVNSVQANQFNNHIGSRIPEDEVYTAQSVCSECRRTGGVGLLHGRSTQINRLAPTWNSHKEDFYRPLASSGSEANQFQSIGNSDSQRYNFIQPRSSTPSRSQQQLNNPSQLLNQVSNRSNASNSLLLHSMLTKDSMPSQLMSQNFSYQHHQVSMTPRAFNPQTYNIGLAKSSMPLRTSTLAPNRQTNPPDVSDLRCHSLQPRSSMLSSLRSYQLPRHQQASSEFSMPSLSNSDLCKSNLPESSNLQRLQQQQGLLNQPARPTPTYPISGTGTGTSLSSIVMNSLPQNETGNTLTPHQVRTPLSNYRERGTSERRQSAPARTRYGLGESSSTFKRFRREPSTLPMQMAASDAERENWNLSSTHNEAGTSSNTGNLSSPRPIKNALYDPLFEWIGLPVDPHLRMFATM
ncbi:hypothetical protein V6Z12_A06G045500 [Gossypium hirsutum]